jgi:raffinose/stachyose/melibiose transport system permease protein
VGTVPLVMDIFFDAFAKRLAGLATAKAILLFLAIVLITGTQLTVMKRREVQQ